MFSFPHPTPATKRQVSIIGLSEYGRSFALSLISRNTATHLVLVDASYQTARGEALDLLDSLPFLPAINLSYSSDPRATAGSSVIVITVGKPFNASFASRLDLLEANTPLVADAAFWASRFSPDATIIVATDPMDVMTFTAAMAAPTHPRSRVIGVGTALDIARMRAAIARETNIDAADVVANIVTEHGDAMVPLWGDFRIRGIPLSAVCPHLTTPAGRQKLQEEVRDACHRIVAAKPEGTSKGIGECLADLTQALLTGGGNVRTVCTAVTARDFAGLQDTVYMSVPCKIGLEGVDGIFPFVVDPEERKQIMHAAEILLKAQKRAASVLAKLDQDAEHLRQFGAYSYSPATNAHA